VDCSHGFDTEILPLDVPSRLRSSLSRIILQNKDLHARHHNSSHRGDADRSPGARFSLAAMLPPESNVTECGVRISSNLATGQRLSLQATCRAS
jgi:hypothetical protein